MLIRESCKILSHIYRIVMIFMLIVTSLVHSQAQTIDTHIKGLKSKDYNISKLAKESLVEMGEVAIPTLTTVLQDKEKLFRMRAISVLGAIPSEKVIEPLKMALRDKKWQVRVAAVDALGLKGHTISQYPAIDLRTVILIDVLKNKKEKDKVRVAAANALGKLGFSSVLEPLINALKNDKKTSVRAEAADALGHLETSFETELRTSALIDALGDKKADVRSVAAEALGKMGSKNAIKPLIAALSDKDGTVRWKAAKSLGELHAVEAVAALVIALKDNNIYARDAAERALKEIDAPVPIPAFIEAVREDSMLGYELLIKRGKAAVQPLIELLDDPERSIRIDALRALSKIGDRRAINPAITKLSDNDQLVRKAAIELLGEFAVFQQSRARAIEPLLAATNHKEKSTRLAATEALIRFDYDPRVVAFFKAALQARNLEVIHSGGLFYIQLGETGTESLIIDALNKYGWTSFALLMLNSGNETLADAAREWARKRKISILYIPGSGGNQNQWGSKQ